MSEIETNISGSEMEEEQRQFEESIWAEIIFKFSDISCFAKWPLLILAIILWLCSIMTWYAGADGGPELLNFDNHGGRGCNILFSDGKISFIRSEDAVDLRWKLDEAQEE